MPENQQDNLQQFLSDLTELSRRHRIGIIVPANLFVMEDEDLDIAYSCDADGMLVF